MTRLVPVMCTVGKVSTLNASSWTSLSSRSASVSMTSCRRVAVRDPAPAIIASKTSNPPTIPIPHRAARSVMTSLFIQTAFQRSLLNRGEGLSWQFFVAHRRIVGEHRDDRSLLDHVVALHALVEIHVRMMRSGVIFEAVHHELEARKADRVERYMIGRRDRTGPRGHDAEIRQRFHPLLEDMPGIEIAL